MSIVIYDQDNTEMAISKLSNGDIFRYTVDNIDRYYMKCKLIFGTIEEDYVYDFSDSKLYKISEKFPEDNEVQKLTMEKIQFNFSSRTISPMTDKTAITTLGSFVFINDMGYISSSDIVDGYYSLIQFYNGMIALYTKDSIDASNGTSLVIHGFDSNDVDLYLG